MKKLFVCMFVLTLACSTTLLAAEAPKVAHADHIIQGKAQPNTSHDPVLCNTIGPSTNEFQLNGYFVAGPDNSLLGESQFMAVACTPSKNVTLTTVKAGWQWYGYGANLIQICLYSDNGSNAPGTQIGNCVTKRNLPDFGTANTLVTVNFSSQSLALTAGTQYWIVGQTPSSGTGDDAVDVWNGGGEYTGYNVAGSGWGSFQADLTPAATISGK